MRILTVGLALFAILPAQAQEGDVVARAQFELRVELLRDMLGEAVRLTPKVDIFSRDGGDTAELARATAKAGESAPQVKSLLAEVEALPDAPRIGDASREQAMSSFRSSVSDVLRELAKGMETIMAPPDATRSASLLVVDAMGVEMDAVRGSALAIGQYCSLDFEASADHAVCGIFAELNAVRSLLQAVKTSAPPVRTQRDKLSASVSRLRALEAEVDTAMSLTFKRNLIMIIDMLQRGVAELDKPSVEETTMMTLLILLSSRSRVLLEEQ